MKIIILNPLERLTTDFEGVLQKQYGVAERGTLYRMTAPSGMTTLGTSSSLQSLPSFVSTAKRLERGRNEQDTPARSAKWAYTQTVLPSTTPETMNRMI